MCTLIVDENFLKRLVAVEFVADQTCECTFIELESRFDYY